MYPNILLVYPAKNPRLLRHSGTGGPVVYGAKVAQCGDVGTFDKCKLQAASTGVITSNLFRRGHQT